MTAYDAIISCWQDMNTENRALFVAYCKQLIYDHADIRSLYKTSTLSEYPDWYTYYIYPNYVAGVLEALAKLDKRPTWAHAAACKAHRLAMNSIQEEHAIRMNTFSSTLGNISQSARKTLGEATNEN